MIHKSTDALKDECPTAPSQLLNIAITLTDPGQNV